MLIEIYVILNKQPGKKQEKSIFLTDNRYCKNSHTHHLQK